MRKDQMTESRASERPRFLAVVALDAAIPVQQPERERIG